MSRCARTWAVSQDIKGASKAVLVVLADHANEAHRAWPSIPLIAQTTGRSERAVQYALTELQARGAIAIERSIGGRGHASHYILNLAWACETTAPPSATTAGRNGAKAAPIQPVNGANAAPFEAVNGANTAPIQPETVQTLHPSESAPETLNGAILSLNGAKVAPEPKIEPKKGREGVASLPARGRARERTPLPEDWEPDAKGERYAAERGVPLDQVEAFRNHHAAKGSQMADWQAAWRTWVDRVPQFSRRSDSRSEWRNGYLHSIAVNGFEHAGAAEPEDAVSAYLRLNGARYGTA